MRQRRRQQLLLVGLLLYSSSWLRMRAAPLVTLMLSCAARSTMALRLETPTLWAISAQNFLQARTGACVHACMHVCVQQEATVDRSGRRASGGAGEPHARARARAGEVLPNLHACIYMHSAKAPPSTACTLLRAGIGRCMHVHVRVQRDTGPHTALRDGQALRLWHAGLMPGIAEECSSHNRTCCAS